MLKVKASHFKGYVPDHSFAMLSSNHTKPVMSNSPKRDLSSILSLVELETQNGNCMQCGLCESRKNMVWGEGSLQSKIVFVGEAPGNNEDELGRPFVGNGGKLLDKMIEAMKLKRDQLYLLNVVKCRPVNNRSPQQEEIESCRPYLEAQLKILKPKVVVALGSVATKVLISSDSDLSALRGKVHDFKVGESEMKVIATYHPSFLLKQPHLKKDCWEDLKVAIKVLGS